MSFAREPRIASAPPCPLSPIRFILSSASMDAQTPSQMTPPHMSVNYEFINKFSSLGSFCLRQILTKPVPAVLYATFSPKTSLTPLPLSARLLGSLQPMISLGSLLPFIAVVAQCRRHLSGSLSPSSPEGHALTLSASFLSWPALCFFASLRPESVKYVLTCMSLSASR